MKEKFLAMLKTKYKDLGLSEKILERYASKLAKATKEEKDIETAVDGVEEDLQVIQSINDAARTENTNLKKQLDALGKGAEKKEDKEDKKEPLKESGTENPELKALTDIVTKLAESVNGMKTEKTVTSRKSVFESKLNELKGLPATDKALRIQLMEALKHESDEDFNTWMEGQVKAAGEIAEAAPSDEFEAMAKPIGGNGKSTKGILSESDVSEALDIIL